jgi:NAD(P)-dependent dehydrogenase (short-subunit alcohol dehydrogenase family)
VAVGSARVAVVTGGGRGIGRAIALQLAVDGLHVHVLARSEVQIEEVAGEIRARGGSACAFALDVSDAASVQRTLGDRAGARCGVPQVLVNAAGVFGPLARVADGDAQAWLSALLTNMVGTYLTCHALVGAMVTTGWGRIVNVSSAAALGTPSPLNSAYSTSKVAVNWFTRCLAVELAGTGVTANTLHPGEVRTEMWRDIVEQAARAGVEGNGLRDWAAMVDRTGGDPPENAAAMVRWLLDDAQSGINGELLWHSAGVKAPILPTSPPPYVIADL